MMDAPHPLNVYLAGPIEEERERWGLVDWNFPDTSKEPLRETPPYREFEFAGVTCIYRGPFVAGTCGHGCAHNTPHGAVGTCLTGDTDTRADLAAVVRRDQAAILSSDAVFAFIPREGCHGTIAEIGYAAALGKPVYLGFAAERFAQSHWFVARMAMDFGIFPTPAALFKRGLELHNVRFSLPAPLPWPWTAVPARAMARAEQR